MHLQWLEAGAIGTNAIVGGGVPLAAGSAWAHRHAGTDAVAVTYFGDGASNIGSTLETLQPRGRVEVAAVLLHREQPVRGVDERRPRPRRSRDCPRAARDSGSAAGRSTAWTRSRST